MSTYSPQELTRRWEHSQLTIEQAIGQLIQHLLDLLQRLAELERRLRQLEQRPIPKA